MNQTTRCLIACGVVLLSSFASGQQPDPGVVRQVTLYRDQVRVTRHIQVPPGKGQKVIEVADLPERVIAESVFAEGDQATAVRAVRVSTQPMAQSSREDIRLLDNQIQELQQEHEQAQHSLEINAGNLKSLEQLISFSIDKGKSDLNRGVLDAATLTELATYAMTQRKELSAEQFRLKGEIKDLDQQMQLLQTKKSELTRGSRQLTYAAKIFVESQEDVAGVVRLNYVVTGCGWSPQYTIRGRTDGPAVELTYSALVQQLSGEDWDGVDLTLSTASPSISAAGPKLTPLRVTVEAATPGQPDPFAQGAPSKPPGTKETLSKKIQGLREQQQQAEQQRPTDSGGADPAQRDLRLNKLAGEMQEIELLAAATSWRRLAQDVEGDIASQTYKLRQPVSLQTRRQQQLVQILEVNLDAEMYHVATPLLSTYAYREAQMTNSGTGLLSGPASVYLDDRFVGRTQIPSTASGQRLTIGFGADQQVRTRRELLDKEDDVQGGNRRLKFVYRLVLANFKDQPVTIRLLDRMPITREQQQVSISMETPDQPLSEDGLYKRIERPLGVLRWDLTVPEGRHGSDAFDVQYSYTAEFDRSRILSAKDMLREMQVDYREMSLPAAAEEMGGFGGGIAP